MSLRSAFERCLSFMFTNSVIGPWTRWFAARVLTATMPPPAHIAIIMDGNRRYARLHGQQITYGHSLGGEALKDTLRWCYELGVTTVTVFAFSLENFKRSEKEVADLLELTKLKLIEYVPELSKEARINFLGNLATLPLDLQRVMRDAQERSRHITGCSDISRTINVCFAYTGTDEIVNTMNAIVQAVAAQELEVDDIDMDLFASSLFTSPHPEPDILIRTSGEVRLSDFLLYQTAHTALLFDSVLWPEYSPANLYKAVAYYQLNRHAIESSRADYAQLAQSTRAPHSEEREKRVAAFIKKRRRDLGLYLEDGDSHEHKDQLEFRAKSSNGATSSRPKQQ